MIERVIRLKASFEGDCAGDLLCVLLEDETADLMAIRDDDICHVHMRLEDAIDGLIEGNVNHLSGRIDDENGIRVAREWAILLRAQARRLEAISS